MLLFFIEAEKVDGGSQLTIRRYGGERHESCKIGDLLPDEDAGDIALWLDAAIFSIQRYIVTEELRSLAENYGTDPHAV